MLGFAPNMHIWIQWLMICSLFRASRILSNIFKTRPNGSLKSLKTPILAELCSFSLDLHAEDPSTRTITGKKMLSGRYDAHDEPKLTQFVE